MTIGHILRKNILPVLKRSIWLRKQNYLSTAIDPKQYKVDNSLLGYAVKEVENIPELNLTAVLLEHKTTGAEHLHLASADSNNLFMVAFCTPPPNSSGVPHILEHLALCGSQRYPCRDPFFNMLNRSLSTFMNAFTGSDTTMYAFSTQNAKDYQNLLSVYLDAAFYPSLNEKDFRQEGWRLEHEDINDKNSPIVFKGSDPSQYYARHLQNQLFPSNAYSHESGGDPLAIPELTWQQLKHFHSTLYHPSNSRFVTYGNMPLEVHLEKIENHVLNNFKKIKIDSEVLDVEAWKNLITDTYENFALSILGTLLVDGPNSPFYQKLLQSGIGPDYSPCTGYDSSLKQSIFSVGLREIGEEDMQRVRELIPSVFKEIIQNGFPQKQIESVLHKIEIATKHRTSNFGLNCAFILLHCDGTWLVAIFINDINGVNSMWNHNGHPISAFKVNDHVNWFTSQMKNNKHFLQDKIVQYFENNNHKLTLIMKPDENFEAQQQEMEKKLLDSKVSRLSDEERVQIYQQGLELAEHQKIVDASCLPSLQIEDVKRSIQKTPIKIVPFENDITVQLYEQPTNEVTYFRALIDVSGLSEEETMLLPLFTSIITQMGAGNLDYKKFDQQVQLLTGKFDVSLHFSEHPSDPTQFTQNILLSSYCLDKNIDHMLELWKFVIFESHLEDQERLTQLIRLTAAEMAQSITYNGHRFAMQKASSSLSPCAELKEKAFGLTQIVYMKQLAEMESHEEILERLRKLHAKLFNRQFLRCSLNATPEFMSKAYTGVHDLLLQMRGLNHKPVHSIVAKSESKKTHFVLPFSVNYIGQSALAVPYCHPDFASLKVAAKLMSSKFLHSEIREKGGAYGGGATVNKGGHFMFYSYRDPNTTKTLQSFSSGIEWLLNGSYSDADITEAKLGVFSEVDTPVPPGSKGSGFFLEEISDDMKQEMRNNIFSCTRQNLINVTQKYLKNTEKLGTALIGPENNTTKSEGWNIIENKL
ncbi:presequence protease, mitochondrial [Caerostris extrusa]|uniref:Presequence protease, mitochondrial n=1 Tax=Caerostris extrusa TaxID=172846 RepID=A0AAV4U1M0_CAEEX|nr:presequence protease, mitochondrial [Caerostris extrusa]